MLSSLETRIKKVEEALKPEAGYLVISHYPCMDEKARQAAVQAAKRRVPPDVEVTLVVFVTEYVDCPKGPHRHTPRHGQPASGVRAQEW